ncbi:MAG: hypothetical protein Q8P81_02905 [Nanoarchaeota archaeon]|nr:hypothetical protein [Nanoarchaeota archaeon]
MVDVYREERVRGPCDSGHDYVFQSARRYTEKRRVEHPSWPMGVDMDREMQSVYNSELIRANRGEVEEVTIEVKVYKCSRCGDISEV